MKSGAVYCSECDDFVYIPELERVRETLYDDVEGLGLVINGMSSHHIQ
jgi:hypothetical protein